MYISTTYIVALLAATNTAQAFEYTSLNSTPAFTSASVSPPPAKRRASGSVLNGILGALGFGNQPQGSCPPVWNEISATLTGQFLANGQCTDAARAAIRAAFHDCFNGACDGSLILADECSRPENRGLERLCGNLGNLAEQKQVGVADLIQFAAAHAIKTCPGGPTVPVKIGRRDSDTASPAGILPTGFTPASSLIPLFGKRGFSPNDLAALIGAHTTAKQRTTDPSRAGASLDSTPGKWDNKYYGETIKGDAPFTLQSDRDLSRNLLTAGPMRVFAVSQGAWAAAFVPAMTKLSMMGVSGNLVDCTSALPGGSAKRDVKSAGVWERLRW